MFGPAGGVSLNRKTYFASVLALHLHTPESRAAAGQLTAAVLLFAVALVVMTLSRFLFLEERPMHTDEAVQAQLYLAPMLEGKGYTYRSSDGHGPMLVMVTRWLGALTGAGEAVEFTATRLRLVPVLFSFGLLALLPLLAGGMSRRALGWAALFTALSPSLAYYSRYYIMEVPLVFFTALAIGAGWRYALCRRLRWMLLLGAAVGLMQVTKETFLIPLIAGVLAVLATHILEYFLTGTGFGQIIKRQDLHRNDRMPWHIGQALIVAVGLAFLFYSGFFKNPGQFFESLKSYTEYAERAEGAGHEKPWWYYLKLLLGRRDEDGFVCGEWPLLILAAIGVGKAFLVPPKRYENKRLERFMAFYTAALLIGYSLIAYKTPWLVLGMVYGVVILAGLGADVLLNAVQTKFPRWVCHAALLAAALYLGGQIWRQNFEFPADAHRNPYVYAHTSPDVLRLVRRVEEAAAKVPDPQQFKVFVLHPEHGWPLPWYFRGMGGGATNVMPEDNTLLVHADVIIAPRDDASLMAALVSSTHREIKEDYFLREDHPMRVIFRKEWLSDLPVTEKPAAEKKAEPEKRLEPEPPAAPALPAEPEPAAETVPAAEPAPPAEIVLPAEPVLPVEPVSPAPPKPVTVTPAAEAGEEASAANEPEVPGEVEAEEEILEVLPAEPVEPTEAS